MNSKYYSFKNLDTFDLRFAINGFTPFYATYKIYYNAVIFDSKNYRRSGAWEKSASFYKESKKVYFFNKQGLNFKKIIVKTPKNN
jgi:hypothetical protein